LTNPGIPKERSLAPAVERAIRILALFEASPQRRFTVTEIARLLRAPKSSILNICTILQDEQLIRRSHEGYQLGRRVVQLGSAYVSSVHLVQDFYDACKAIPRQVQALVQLAVLSNGLDAVYLARQDCDSGLQLGLRGEIGRRTPANCTGIGKALLAALPVYALEARLEHIRTLPTMTEKSIATPHALRKRLESVRQLGYAMDDEEVLPGIVCIACTAKTEHREDKLVGLSLTARKDTQSDDMFELRRSALLELSHTLSSRW
jgi:IclR family transcriptional regulator, blcABC operon repressor